uniref:Uncharacterized protein n=1 Tax=Glossina palpalis gambiensis TaxID=67801 RepID=A0A1B0ALT2_9MUSC
MKILYTTLRNSTLDVIAQGICERQDFYLFTALWRIILLKQHRDYRFGAICPVSNALVYVGLESYTDCYIRKDIVNIKFCGEHHKQHHEKQLLIRIYIYIHTFNNRVSLHDEARCNLYWIFSYQEKNKSNLKLTKEKLFQKLKKNKEECVNKAKKFCSLTDL